MDVRKDYGRHGDEKRTIVSNFFLFAETASCVDSVEQGLGDGWRGFNGYYVVISAPTAHLKANSAQQYGLPPLRQVRSTNYNKDVFHQTLFVKKEWKPGIQGSLL